MTGPRDVLLLLTLEPRPKFRSALTAYARSSRMTVITLTDHRFIARAQRFSRIVIGSHVATYGALPTHRTRTSLLRLPAVAFLEDIIDEIDLFD